MPNRRKILVVDDDATVREVLTTLLDAEGYEVRVLPSGEHLVPLCRRWQPDVVLLDMMMVPMDGWMVLRTLREAGLTPTLPVVVLSAMGSASQDYTALEIMARARGARAWEVKPINLHDLLAVIEAPPPPADEAADE